MSDDVLGEHPDVLAARTLRDSGLLEDGFVGLHSLRARRAVNAAVAELHRALRVADVWTGDGTRSLVAIVDRSGPGGDMAGWRGRIWPDCAPVPVRVDGAADPESAATFTAERLMSMYADKLASMASDGRAICGRDGWCDDACEAKGAHVPDPLALDATGEFAAICVCGHSASKHNDGEGCSWGGPPEQPCDCTGYRLHVGRVTFPVDGETPEQAAEAAKDADWHAEFSVGNQHFDLARASADDAEGEEHCRFIADQFVAALARGGLIRPEAVVAWRRLHRVVPRG